jgi:hypothetical protein
MTSLSNLACEKDASPRPISLTPIAFERFESYATSTASQVDIGPGEPMLPALASQRIDNGFRQVILAVAAGRADEYAYDTPLFTISNPVLNLMLSSPGSANHHDFRRVRRSEPSSDSREVEHLIERALGRRRSREAYAIFEELVGVVKRSVAVDVLNPVTAYLCGQKSDCRDVLLSCFADHDVALVDTAVLRAIGELCANVDRGLARAAAAALDAGGDDARDTLRSTLAKLPESARRDCEQFVAFASTV